MTSPNNPAEEIAKGLSEGERRDFLGLRHGTVAPENCVEFVRLGIMKWSDCVTLRFTPLGLEVLSLLERERTGK